MAVTKLNGRQVEVFTTTSDGVVPAPTTSTGKVLSDNGTWINVSGGGGLNTISGTSNFDFGNEGDFSVNTITNGVLTSTNLKTVTFIPIETSSTSLDDFTLNAVTFNIENIVDNTSFDIRATAFNNASGVYQIKYLINY